MIIPEGLFPTTEEKIRIIFHESPKAFWSEIKKLIKKNSYNVRSLQNSQKMQKMLFQQTKIQIVLMDIPEPLRRPGFYARLTVLA